MGSRSRCDHCSRRFAKADRYRRTRQKLDFDFGYVAHAVQGTSAIKIAKGTSVTDAVAEQQRI